MNATDNAEIKMNTAQTTNQRLVTILLVLLIVLVALIIIGAIITFLMPGSMMGGGMMMGMNGQTMNEMVAACTNMMGDLQRH